MEDQPILMERRTGYRVITLNRPHRLNAFTEAMHLALRGALAEAEADNDCRALLLTGAGRFPIVFAEKARAVRAGPVSASGAPLAPQIGRAHV